MGLFNLFKKKEEAPAQMPNTTNSLYTLRFAIPFFSVFDKTSPKLKAFPVKLAVGGSVQYRILDLNMCFDNVPLGKMSPAQLEAHVKDSLVSSVKHFINTIDYLPLLQFETELMAINDAAKKNLVPQFAEEYGIDLRTFNLSRITYDEDDPNYKRLYEASASMADLQGEQALEDQGLDHEHSKRVRDYKEEDELHELEQRKKLRNLVDDDEYESKLHELERRKKLRDIGDDDEYESLLHQKRLRDMEREDEVKEREHARDLHDLEKSDEITERGDDIIRKHHLRELDLEDEERERNHARELRDLEKNAKIIERGDDILRKHHLHELDLEDEDRERERNRSLRDLEKDQDMEDFINNRARVRRRQGLEDDEELIERESALEMRRHAKELEMRRNENRLRKEDEQDKLDMERKRRELDEEMYARRRATDTGASLANKLGQGNKPKLERDSRPYLRQRNDGDDLDLGSL